MVQYHAANPAMRAVFVLREPLTRMISELQHRATSYFQQPQRLRRRFLQDCTGVFRSLSGFKASHYGNIVQ